MPKTVAEILKESGLTDEQIKAIDAKALEGLDKYATEANTSLEKAELALRAQREEYDKNIAPALASWADRDTAISTKLATYETFINKVKESGYLPKEILDTLPSFGTPQNPANPAPGTRDASGRFVAGANPVPGSPAFVGDLKKEVSNELAAAFTFAADTQWKYRSLFGQEMPDPPTTLIREAAQNRMSPQEWAAKKYNFVQKEQERIQAAEKAKIDAAVKEAVAAKEKEWSEKIGNNPNVRTPVESEFATVSKAVAEGKRQDPLKMTPEQRKANTHSNIQKEFAERSSTVQ
jgi:hypothetical protein